MRIPEICSRREDPPTRTRETNSRPATTKTATTSHVRVLSIKFQIEAAQLHMALQFFSGHKSRDLRKFVRSSNGLSCTRAPTCPTCRRRECAFKRPPRNPTHFNSFPIWIWIRIRVGLNGELVRSWSAQANGVKVFRFGCIVQANATMPIDCDLHNAVGGKLNAGQTLVASRRSNSIASRQGQQKTHKRDERKVPSCRSARLQRARLRDVVELLLICLNSRRKLVPGLVFAPLWV